LGLKRDPVGGGSSSNCWIRRTRRDAPSASLPVRRQGRCLGLHQGQNPPDRCLPCGGGERDSNSICFSTATRCLSPSDNFPPSNFGKSLTSVTSRAAKEFFPLGVFCTPKIGLHSKIPDERAAGAVKST
jgi:hypothetical protein